MTNGLNAGKLFNCVCEQLEHDLYIRSNSFSIREDSGMTEEELIDNISRIDQGKYTPPNEPYTDRDEDSDVEVEM